MTSLIDRPAILIAAGTVLAISAGWCIKDYRDYLALGPGGPPYNIFGWAVITFAVRPFALSKANAISVKDYPVDGAHEEIQHLPRRKGERARVGGIAPHRQLSQNSPKDMEADIRALFTSALEDFPSQVELRKSEYERHNDALFISKDLLSSSTASLPQTAIIARGEIGHVHPDLSIHVYLSPADARVVIEKGWGERHRLATPANSWSANKFHIASTYIMLYGPRDEEELDVVRTIVRHGVRYMIGAEA